MKGHAMTEPMTILEFAQMRLDNSRDFEFPAAETKRDRKILIRSLEMLGSPNAGERDAAAL
jgi:hypothetical protein